MRTQLASPVESRTTIIIRRSCAPLPPLQPVERSPERTMEGGGKGDGLESGQMPTCADL